MCRTKHKNLINLKLLLRNTYTRFYQNFKRSVAEEQKENLVKRGVQKTTKLLSLRSSHIKPNITLNKNKTSRFTKTNTLTSYQLTTSQVLCKK